MIVVTAPTGTIGRRLVSHLIAAGQRPRVIVRDPARLADAIRDDVDVVQGSSGDRDVVRRAFAGSDAVFWLVPPDPRASSVHDAYVTFSEPARDAVVEHDVGRVVTVSALGRGTPLAHRAGFVTASLAMDDLMAGAAGAHRALTMPSFMDNLLRQAASIRDQGMFFSPISGDRRAPSCAARDIASAAADLLLDPTWIGTGEVAVLGPEDLSFDDMAEVMSDVLGQPVRFQQTPAESYRERLSAAGMSDAMAQGMVDMALAKDGGLDNAVVRTSENSTPTTFRQWCQDELVPAMSR